MIVASTIVPVETFSPFASDADALPRTDGGQGRAPRANAGTGRLWSHQPLPRGQDRSLRNHASSPSCRALPRRRGRKGSTIAAKNKSAAPLKAIRRTPVAGLRIKRLIGLVCRQAFAAPCEVNEEIDEVDRKDGGLFAALGPIGVKDLPADGGIEKGGERPIPPCRCRSGSPS